MSFLLLIFGNLLRQKIRTGLTVLGISIGITTVVALGIITNSALQATGALLTAGGSDFSVGRAGSADMTFSILTDEDLATVASYPGVEHVTPTMLAISRVGSNAFFIQFGIPPDDDRFEVNIIEGRELQDNDTGLLLLGDQAASDLGKDVGDKVVLRETTGETFTVVGIYDSGVTYLDGGTILPLGDLQELEDKHDLYSYLYVYLDEDTDAAQLAAQIEVDHPGLATLLEISDVADVDEGLNLLDEINLAVTILAIFIGGIAAMNTMVMAVFERTREFGILRAVGWRTRRILQLVVGESLLLCLLASLFGSALAVGLTRLIILVPTIRAFITPIYTPEEFIRGVIVGVGVALLGAIYPAYRAARLSPAQAIRYE